jgi:glycosyltransferase involved in cell wall biosynthesis
VRIAIDARAASHPQPGGFKTYTENLIRSLARVDGENRYILYLDRRVSDGELPQQPNFTNQVVPPPIPAVGVAIREQMLLPRRLAYDQVDLVHFPCATAAILAPCPFIVTIHDAIELWETPRLPNFWSPEFLKRLGMHLYLRYAQIRAACMARAIITVSHNSKRDIVRRFKISAEKIFVTYEAPTEIYRPEDNEGLVKGIRQKYGLAPGFVLAIASASPRKNAQGLVTAYARLGDDLIEAHPLVIVWTHGLLRGEITRLVCRLGLETKVSFLEKVPDEDLVLLYNAASVFVFPSLYEGFGLPPLEAMACGTPVVASNTSSLPEILDDGALLVNPRDTEALARAMREVLTCPELRMSMREKGLKRAQAFSWEKTARETVAIYQQVVKEWEVERHEPNCADVS